MRLITCRRVRRTLQWYLDGELNDDAAGRVVRHLERCRRCAVEAETYQAIKESLGPRPGSPDVVQRLRDFGEALLDDPGGEPSHAHKSARG